MLVHLDDFATDSCAECDRIFKAMQPIFLRRFPESSSRFGPLAYVVLLTGEDASNAYNIAESIRKEVESLKIPTARAFDYGDVPLPAYVTVHIGLPRASSDRVSWSTLVDLTKEARKAISDGLEELRRNRIFIPSQKSRASTSSGQA
jgi:GGDEF domain-containing protein